MKQISQLSDIHGGAITYTKEELAAILMRLEDPLTKQRAVEKLMLNEEAVAQLSDFKTFQGAYKFLKQLGPNFGLKIGA